jgi:hypothetical protein|tara:strand:+ start:1936 stop:2139 length:204 start_codon:yes stop_codon:yes gene_type:complete
MFVANFLGGPDRGDHYRKPINVQATLIDFLVYKIFGVHTFLNRFNKKWNQDFNQDYFKGVLWISKRN